MKRSKAEGRKSATSRKSGRRKAGGRQAIRPARAKRGLRRGVTLEAASLELGSHAPESSTLLVDIHCHVFSGRDIPLFEFLHFGRGIPRPIAYMVQWLITHPSQDTPANRERAKQVAISETGGTQSDFQEAEDRGLLGRFFAYADLMGRPVKSIAASMVDTYRDVQLFTPAMVDMDCWLGDASFYDDRVQDHAELALSKDKDRRGRIHPIVGFDPVRQHATRTVFGEGQDHLAQVERAIEEQGFVGVKVYPPMGFRATRNDWVYPAGSIVSRPNLAPVACKLAPDATSKPVSMTGTDLDRAMLQLFDYCIAEDVPVMAHCTSHGAEAAKGRGYNADARFWKHLLQMDNGRYANLRLNLSHVGGDSHRPSFLDGVLELMVTFPNVYADVGAHALVWEDGEPYRDSFSYELISALEEDRDWTRRVMLGSDWHTIYVEASPSIYLHKYMEFFDQLSAAIDAQSTKIGKPLSQDDDPTRRANFRGLSALRFLGLDRGHADGKARKRLEAFYLDNGIFTLKNGDQPAWW
jgi:predicted TIM-barrel fold metal-dependent hydrolase